MYFISRQKPKYETRNILYWITSEVNIVWWGHSASLSHIAEKFKQFIKKFYKKYVLELFFWNKRIIFDR